MTSVLFSCSRVDSIRPREEGEINSILLAFEMYGNGNQGVPNDWSDLEGILTVEALEYYRENYCFLRDIDENLDAQLLLVRIKPDSNVENGKENTHRVIEVHGHKFKDSIVSERTLRNILSDTYGINETKFIDCLKLAASVKSRSRMSQKIASDDKSERSSRLSHQVIKGNFAVLFAGLLVSVSLLVILGRRLARQGG